MTRLLMAILASPIALASRIFRDTTLLTPLFLFELLSGHRLGLKYLLGIEFFRKCLPVYAQKLAAGANSRGSDVLSAKGALCALGVAFIAVLFCVKFPRQFAILNFLDQINNNCLLLFQLLPEDKALPKVLCHKYSVNF